MNEGLQRAIEILQAAIARRSYPLWDPQYEGMLYAIELIEQELEKSEE